MKQLKEENVRLKNENLGKGQEIKRLEDENKSWEQRMERLEKKFDERVGSLEKSVRELKDEKLTRDLEIKRLGDENSSLNQQVKTLKENLNTKADKIKITQLQDEIKVLKDICGYSMRLSRGSDDKPERVGEFCVEHKGGLLEYSLLNPQRIIVRGSINIKEQGFDTIISDGKLDDTKIQSCLPKIIKIARQNEPDSLIVQLAASNDTIRNLRDKNTQLAEDKNELEQNMNQRVQQEIERLMNEADDNNSDFSVQYQRLKRMRDMAVKNQNYRPGLFKSMFTPPQQLKRDKVLNKLLPDLQSELNDAKIIDLVKNVKNLLAQITAVQEQSPDREYQKRIFTKLTSVVDELVQAIGGIKDDTAIALSDEKKDELKALATTLSLGS